MSAEFPVAAPRNSTFAQALPKLGGAIVLTGSGEYALTTASARHGGIASAKAAKAFPTEAGTVDGIGAGQQHRPRADVR